MLINGSFAVGKTTVAQQLVEHIPNSMLYDPEAVGSCLSHIVRPIVQVEDFQDLAMWRTLTITIAQLLQQTYQRTMVIPMTIWYEPYFHEIISGLQQFEPEVLHFCLTASSQTIFERLAGRRLEHTPEAYEWICQRIEHCVGAFQTPAFAVHIGTEGRKPDEIASEILRKVCEKLPDAC